MGVNDYFDYEFDGDVESQADEIVHEAKDKLVDLIYGNAKSEIEEDRKNYLRAKERADELQKECYENREKINVLEIELKKVKGELVNNPKYLKQSLNKLAKAQRELSRKSKGGSNRNKARIKVARLYEKISNQRKDFLQKLST